MTFSWHSNFSRYTCTEFQLSVLLAGQISINISGCNINLIIHANTVPTAISVVKQQIFVLHAHYVLQTF